MNNSESLEEYVCSSLFKDVIAKINKLGNISARPIVGIGANIIGSALGINTEKHQIEFSKDIDDIVLKWTEKTGENND